jgi:pyruvate-ferredoxin/flavodoxin oxidoreductase
MGKKTKETMEGNQAAAHVAYAYSDVAAIYPITPSSDMGQLADAWASEKRNNIFGQPVDVVEMQSEAGAAGSVHGALAAGSLTTTFTASQGLLLMIPNMHKIAGELLPAVFHVSARSIACQSLSIFGDHSDVMGVRNTGFGMLASASVQEIMDLGAVAHLAAIRNSLPFLHFFDGFRNSHEVSKIEVTDYETLRGLLDHADVEKFRARALNPDAPKVKVGAQNPDVYFQGRETVNKFYDACPDVVQHFMDKVGKAVGRKYKLFDYVGSKDADRIIIAMGSGCETIEEAIEYLQTKGYKIGLIKVRLFRPFSLKHFLKAIPATCKKIAVLDRTKEPGSLGEPLYQDVVTALKDRKDTYIIGGRYGLSSKEFTPSMVKAIYDHLNGAAFHGFTVGIEDDVTKKSLKVKDLIHTIPAGTISCLFWGFGSDGTVGANKNSIKIIGDHTDMYAQGYFQYDSKKSGGITRSHLRFGKTKIRSQYLVTKPDFVACHNQAFIGRYDMLSGIKNGGTFLLNSNWCDKEVFNHLTADMQKIIIDRKIKFYNIDALKISESVGLGKRINTIMQTAFFLISGVLDRKEAVKMIKESIDKTYSKKGKKIVEMNWKAVDTTNAALVEIKVPKTMPTKSTQMKKLIPDKANKFTREIIEPIMKEQGNVIKVSQMPIDGVMETGTTYMEKRGVAAFVPRWCAEKCIQCNLCAIICPHASIRPKQFSKAQLKGAPKTFQTLKAMGKNDLQYKIQVYIEDCQGCEQCVVQCPKKALEMKPVQEERDRGEVANEAFFTKLPEDVLGEWNEFTVKGSQFKQPLMEFSGACAGCRETPYVKLITQFYGDRMIIANATGCSSIWGGTFPSIPYCKNKDGHGPAWANSLFEDNAEYGFGMRLAVSANRRYLYTALEKLEKATISAELKKACKYALKNWTAVDTPAKDNANNIKKLLEKEITKAKGDTLDLLQKVDELKNFLIEKSVWCFGGDGWAYDIGFGGVDHVLAANRNVKILVMDTEVYSNTGGQASKATPLGGVARFAEAGKPTTKKDLGLMMMSYGYVYVASVAMGANMTQLITAIKEAEEYDGPAIILAYAPCINHGIRGIGMAEGVIEEKRAVDSGYWLLYRYNPMNLLAGKNPFTLDSKQPTMDVREFIDGETRFTTLSTTSPEKMKEYREGTAEFIKQRWEYYKHLSEKK